MARHPALSCSKVALGLALCAAPSLLAQQPAPPASAPAQPLRSTVNFRNGLLTVDASNASLNAILREIAHSTGMKISGSVPEDRVFGTYGPADPQRVMSTLLDGTGTNIFIVSNTADKPLELRLTPRSGAPSPPNPNASAEQADDSDQPYPAPPQPVSTLSPRPFRAGAPQPASPDPAAATAPSEISQPVVFPPISPTTPPATATTTPADPDNDADTGTETVKTPQQIFEQLQALQQNGAGSGNTTTPQQQQQK